MRLEDGRTLPADLVVMAVGIRPHTALAKEAGLEVKRGIVVDDHLRTSDASIYAVGECVEHRGQCYGLVAPLYEMAKHARGRRSPASRCRGYAGSAISTKLKVTGIDLFSAGDFSEGDENDEIVLRDPARGVYKRVVLRDNRIVGAVLYGDTADGSWYFDLLKKGADIARDARHADLRPGLSGRRRARSEAAVAALSDDAEICGCNGVCKGVITRAIAAKGLTTLDDVRAQTKASASCGQCTSKVEALLPSRWATPMRPPAASRCANASTSPTTRCAASSSRRN